MSGPEIDLVAPRSYEGDQPHEQFDWLREHDPVHWHPETDGSGFWAVTRHADVRRVSRDTDTFSSSPTIMLEDPNPQQQDQMGDHQMMLMVDPPLHTAMRRFISHRFTPRASALLTHRIDQLAAAILDEVVQGERCDLISDVAGEMPSFVIAELLGIPLADGRDLYRHTEALHSSKDALAPGAKAEAYRAMFDYSQRVWADKQADPSDDLSSLLVHGEIAGRPLDPIDFFLWFLLLIDAGGDTTRNLVGGGMWALLAQPDQLELLRSDPQGLLPSAVEELLRWVSPVVYMRRTATCRTRLGERIIEEGDKVAVFYGAANRDPDVFDDPHRMDLNRDPNPHLAFGGGGPHLCLGAHLARIEITALLRQILLRLDDLEVDGPVHWMTSNFIYGPTTLPVRFHPVHRT